MSKNSKPANRLLAALPLKEYQRMLPNLEQVSLSFAEDIYESGDVIRHVYFLESGIISLLAAVGERSLLEVGIVGSEGMVGLSVFLGAKTSNNRAIVQGKGFALKMTATSFQTECNFGGKLPKLLQHFTHSLMTQISQSAVCYRFHPIEARLARWLMMTFDRMKTEEFRLTQNFLSNMLGVRREAVNKAATNLQKQKLIDYRRGNISILNQAALETVACQCYEIIKREYGKSLKN